MPVVSFTFGSPAPDSVAALHERGCAVWVTSPPARGTDRAGRRRRRTGCPGDQAGGHRAFFRDDSDHEEYGLLVLLRLLAAETDVPLIAAGGIMDGPGIAAVLCAGAAAAQLGSALMLTPEAATSRPHRDRLAQAAPTRPDPGVQRPHRPRHRQPVHGRDATRRRRRPIPRCTTSPPRSGRPRAHPVTRRAVDLWAGQAHALARERPELVAGLAASAAQTLADLPVASPPDPGCVPALARPGDGGKPALALSHDPRRGHRPRRAAERGRPERSSLVCQAGRSAGLGAGLVAVPGSTIDGR